MSECAEVAAAMQPPRFATMDKAREYVRQRMPGETPQVIDNIAWMLWVTQP